MSRKGLRSESKATKKEMLIISPSGKQTKKIVPTKQNMNNNISIESNDKYAKIVISDESEFNFDDSISEENKDANILGYNRYTEQTQKMKLSEQEIKLQDDKMTRNSNKIKVLEENCDTFDEHPDRQ